MKLYSYNEYKHPRVWSKYFLDFDKRLTGLVNYIDFTNPNYILLNHQQNRGIPCFYTDDQLKSIGIIEVINEGTEENPFLVTYVHAERLHAHHGIVNKYGKNTYIVFEHDDDSSDDSSEERTISYSKDFPFDEGFVIISNVVPEINGSRYTTGLRSSDLYSLLDCYRIPLSSSDYIANINTGILQDGNYYLYHALGASGTYYTLDNWSVFINTGEFTYTPHATSIYGSSFLVTLLNGDQRWVYDNGTGLQSVVTTSDHILLESSPSNLGSLIAASEDTSKAYWTAMYPIDYELLTLEDGVYEEVIADTYKSIISRAENGEGKSILSITTNIPRNTFGSLFINYF